MFLVFSKEKIYTYLVSILTVVVLLCVASNVNFISKETIETSSNSERLLPIYKVKTEEKKVALTMNCAWNADDMDKILVGDWIDKFPEYVKKISEAGHEIR